MSSLLVIFGGDRPDAPLAWRLLDGSGDVVAAGEGGLSDLAGERGREAVLVLPGYLVSAIEASLPARSERQALAAAPFAVEDELASDPDTLHFALLPARREGGAGVRTVLAVDRELLAGWTGEMAEAGLSLRAVLADFLCLPGEADQVFALGTADRLVIRHGDWGTAIDGDIALAVAPAAIEARNCEGVPVLLAGEAHGVDGLEPAGDDAREPLAVLAAGARRAGPGLLQGAFAVRRGTGGGEARSAIALLRWPAMLAAAATLAFSAVNLVQGLMLEARAEAVREETRTLFRSAFPGTERVVNVRAQLREASQAGDGARPDFLILSGYMAAGLEAVEAVSVESLRFDGESREISASILFDSYDALARFRAAVEAAGGRVVEGGSRQVGDRRAGDVKVTLP